MKYLTLILALTFTGCATQKKEVDVHKFLGYQAQTKLVIQTPEQTLHYVTWYDNMARKCSVMLRESEESLGFAEKPKCHRL